MWEAKETSRVGRCFMHSQVVNEAFWQRCQFLPVGILAVGFPLAQKEKSPKASKCMQKMKKFFEVRFELVEKIG